MLWCILLRDIAGDISKRIYFFTKNICSACFQRISQNIWAYLRTTVIIQPRLGIGSFQIKLFKMRTCYNYINEIPNFTYRECSMHGPVYI